jgi:hypothetical protein
MEDGDVRIYGYVFLVNNGSHLLELINDVIVLVDEGGIFMETKESGFDKKGSESMFDSPTFDNTYSAISISHLRTVFYLLMLG